MDLRQLNALVAVADHGTFSAAADALNTVQSNVSTHVARLEKEVGTILVDRAGGGLTAEGAAVVERARRIQAELESLDSEVAAFRDEVTGNVRLGMIGTTARWLSPPLLDAMAERHPGVHMVIVDATSTSLEPQLASGRLDLAVVNLPMPAPDLMTTPLFDEDLLLVVPDNHPLASAGRADMGDLADLDLLLPAPGTAFREEIDAAARAEGVTLRPRAELDGVRLIASLTMDGRGPAILPATALPGWVQGRWVGIPVMGLPRRSVGLAQRRRGLPSPPVRALLEVLYQVVRDGLEGEAGLHVPAVDT
ncbi:MAG: hypothetical protein QOG03_940 [Actinomycetota bacterium]|jgi:LysR family hydrogen peroxide-inducible transcriptional activator|nr:hypothetical protein [Actinomycetota bacterium]